MKLSCYTFPGWNPRIRPASSRRDWMDETPDSFAYRCLPLKIANAHGWELLSPCGFSAIWDGTPATDGIRVTPDPGVRPESVPVSLFGHGVLTFHVEGIIRTPPGWNLWVGGSPNGAKDAIAPLGGVIETDWSPYSFTMNWRFTRANQAIRFEENEPFAFIFPVERGVIDAVEPEIVPIEEAPELKRQFEDWSRSRDAFQERMQKDPPSAPADKWQKFYYRGLDPSGCPHIGDHQTKLRPAPFPGIEIPPDSSCPDTPAADAPRPDFDLAKRDWLLRSLVDLRALSDRTSGIMRYRTIGAEQFLDLHYASNRPAILTEEIAGWPALQRWTPEYLKQKIGDGPVEYQGGRDGDQDYELRKDNHRRTMPFADFIDRITAEQGGNDAYVTAYNSARNAETLAPLVDDLGAIDHLLDPQAENASGMMWIGPAGTFTPLHHDLTNNLLVQITGSKQIVMVPPEELPRLYNDTHVFSQIRDLENLDLTRFPEAAGLRVHRIALNAGEALFIPLGWWHQVVATDFSVSITFTNFRWRNDFHEGHP